MQPKPPYVKAISILHIALLIGQLLFGMIMLTLVSLKQTGSFGEKDNSQLWLAACIVIAALAFFISNLIFKKKLELINKNNESVSKKLEAYRAASINRWAVLEAATLFCIVIFYRTSDYLIIIIAAVLLSLSYAARPVTEKIVTDLNITLSDLDNADADSKK